MQSEGKYMLYFENDYCEGAHPAILQKLVETNFEKVSGYGTDPYCASAREKIRAACGARAAPTRADDALRARKMQFTSPNRCVKIVSSNPRGVLKWVWQKRFSWQ